MHGARESARSGMGCAASEEQQRGCVMLLPYMKIYMMYDGVGNGDGRIRLTENR